MAVWPAGLPQGHLIGLSFEREPETIRTPTDGGPAKVRRRFTSRVRPLTAEVVFTNAQKGVFDSFFDNTLLAGSLPFDREDPETGATVSMRIKAYPSFKLQLGGADGKLWIGTLPLEVLP